MGNFDEAAPGNCSGSFLRNVASLTRSYGFELDPTGLRNRCDFARLLDGPMLDCRWSSSVIDPSLDVSIGLQRLRIAVMKLGSLYSPGLAERMFALRPPSTGNAKQFFQRGSSSEVAVLEELRSVPNLEFSPADPTDRAVLGRTVVAARLGTPESTARVDMACSE